MLRPVLRGAGQGARRRSAADRCADAAGRPATPTRSIPSSVAQALADKIKGASIEDHGPLRPLGYYRESCRSATSCLPISCNGSTAERMNWPRCAGRRRGTTGRSSMADENYGWNGNGHGWNGNGSGNRALHQCARPRCDRRISLHRRGAGAGQPHQADHARLARASARPRRRRPARPSSTAWARR